MVRTKINKRDEDRINGSGRYWKPERVGDCLEGKILDIFQKEFEGKEQGEVCLIESPDGDKETPAHKDLQEYLPQVHLDDYVWITCTSIEEKEFTFGSRKGEKYNTYTYDLEIDIPEQDVIE